MNIDVNKTSIDCCLWAIERDLIKKHGTAQAQRDMQPLRWYVNTGRASLDFLRLLMTAKPFMVARKLHEGGCDTDVVDRVKRYIGYKVTYTI